jgi:hypothetical protein
MVYIVTHGNQLGEASIPRRTAQSALRAVHDLQDEGVDYIRIEDPEGHTISLSELIIQARGEAPVGQWSTRVARYRPFSTLPYGSGQTHS